jgi:hypothetical protein
MSDPRLLLDLEKSPDGQQRWKNALSMFLRFLTVQQQKPMVLKSPPHGFRLPSLASLFPQARYVVIERNPYEVFASNLKLWRTLIDQYALESEFVDAIESFVLAAYVLHEEAIEKGRRDLQSGSIATVRYEDLVANPTQQIQRLYSELGLNDFESVRPRIEEHAASVRSHSRNNFFLSASQKAAVDTAWGEIITQKGYVWNTEYVKLEAG